MANLHEIIQWCDQTLKAAAEKITHQMACKLKVQLK